MRALILTVAPRPLRNFPFRVFWEHLKEQRAASTSKAIAFDFFFALLPMLALSAWILARVLDSDPEALEQSTLYLELTPREARALVQGSVRSFSSSGVAPVLGLTSWWLASSGFHTLIRLFQETFECKPRSFLEIRALGLAFALLGITLFPLGAAIGLFLQVEPEGRFSSLIIGSLAHAGVTRWLGIGGFVVLSTSYFALLYRFSLHRPFARRRVCIPGALAASLIGTLASAGWGYYVARLEKFSLVYGGLFTVIVLILWLLLWSRALIFGAVLNITLEDQDRVKNADHSSERGADLDPTHTPKPGAKSAGA